MADLEDGPEQEPLPGKLVEDTVLRLLPRVEFDLVITHGPEGEYTRHRRHEEVSRGVTGLWSDGGLCTREMWLFAYSDDGGAAPVHARPDAHRVRTLSVEQWRRKRQIIAQIYGFGPESFEARNAPRTEAFWCFGRPEAYVEWRKGREQKA
jgi:LmbE family N-acetylglucosaminyl deacetylase